ncbi:MAG: ABC-type transport auxiliary lipoprotein family protein [Candidatus Aminicenantes bacterium]|nr:ABC-type transport auxiliary lipoprotein family protein [Candidatus Aminicenantes bacterium]
MKKSASFFSIVFIFIFICLFCLAGCISSSPGKRYFQLYLGDEVGAAKRPEPAKKLDKIIFVENVAVDGIYDDYRIVYRSSPFQLNYYSYDSWIKKPGELIKDAIFDYLTKSMLFKNVTGKLADGEPDYLLKTRVDCLEEYDLGNVWFAHLQMQIEIEDYKSGKRVVFSRFDRRSKLNSRKVEFIPRAVSLILKEELVKVIDRLFEQLEK